MAGSVFIDQDDIIEIKAVGTQTEASLTVVGKQLQELTAELSTRGKTVLMLDDITQLTGATPAARRLVVHLGKTLKYDRLAMLGKPGSMIRIGANLLLAAMGRGATTKYFDDRAKAITWLLGK